MVVLVDYRPALRGRTGVGEYVHELLAALSRMPAPDEELHLFTSSLRDRLDPTVGRDLPGLRVHDLRVPVRVLNWAWHRHGRPSVERLVRRRIDVVHAAHPLLIPSVGAAQVVTIHDLDFLDHPDQASAEIRRDYPRLVRDHARRANAVLTSSAHTAAAILDRLDVPPDRVTVCPPGPPRWTNGGRQQPRPSDGYLLFVGTLSPRKNVGTLLDAYERLTVRRRDAPPLRLAGGRTRAAKPWLARMAQPPLAGRVEYLGYVADADRRRLYEGASLLVLPSWHEGFGLPALEAMALGVPVVAARAGALPDVVGPAGLLFDPSDPEALADVIERLLSDTQLATACAAAGVARSRAWSWSDAAERVRAMYRAAVAHRSVDHAHRD